MSSKSFLFIFLITLLTFSSVYSNELDLFSTVDIRNISLKNLSNFLECFEETPTNKNFVYALKDIPKGVVFLQIKYISSLGIYEYFLDKKTTLYEKAFAGNIGGSDFFYLKPQPLRDYFIQISSPKKFVLCMKIIPDQYTSFNFNEEKTVGSFELFVSANVFLKIEKKEELNFNSFLAIRYSKSQLRLFEEPNMNITAVYDRPPKKKIKNIELYEENDFLYIMFYAPTLTIEETGLRRKVRQLTFDISLNLKNEMMIYNPAIFQLEFVDTNEIHESFFLSMNAYNIPFNRTQIFYIDVQKMSSFNLETILFTNDLENYFYRPMLTTSERISNKTAKLIENHFMLISSRTVNVKRDELLFFLIDGTVPPTVGGDKNYTINFEFFGGREGLLHYSRDQNFTRRLFKNEDYLVLKKDICRSQYFINFKKESQEIVNNDLILDVFNIHGKIKLIHSKDSLLESENYYDYLNQLMNTSRENDVENYVINGNFSFLVIDCEKSDPVYSIIYSYKKNSEYDTISFKMQRSLLFIQNGKRYQLRFDPEINYEEFDFSIRIHKSSVLDYLVKVNYGSVYADLTDINRFTNLKHEQGSDRPIIIEGFSQNFRYNGVILEIIRGTEYHTDNITLQFAEIGNAPLEEGKGYIFTYDPNKIETFGARITIKNDRTKPTKIWIRKGFGNYPFYQIQSYNKTSHRDLGKVPGDIIIQPEEQYEIFFENPALTKKKTEGIGNDRNNNNINNYPPYISIVTTNDIKYSYSYDKLSILEQNKYFTTQNATIQNIKITNNILELNNQASPFSVPLNYLLPNNSNPYPIPNTTSNVNFNSIPIPTTPIYSNDTTSQTPTTTTTTSQTPTTTTTTSQTPTSTTTTSQNETSTQNPPTTTTTSQINSNQNENSNPTTTINSNESTNQKTSSTINSNTTTTNDNIPNTTPTPTPTSPTTPSSTPNLASLPLPIPTPNSNTSSPSTPTQTSSPNQDMGNQNVMFDNRGNPQTYVPTYSIYYQFNPCVLELRSLNNKYNLYDSEGFRTIKGETYEETKNKNINKLTISTGSETIFKFKYTTGISGLLFFNKKYNKLIKYEQNSFKITLSMETPFMYDDDMDLKILVLKAPPKDKNIIKNFCEIIDLFEKGEDRYTSLILTKNFKYKENKEKINNENSTSTSIYNNKYITVDIQSQEIGIFNFHEVDFYVIITSKRTNLDAVSYVNNVYLGLNINVNRTIGPNGEIETTAKGGSTVINMEGENKTGVKVRNTALYIIIGGSLLVICALIFALLKSKYDEREIRKYHRLTEAYIKGNLRQKSERIQSLKDPETIALV